MPLQANRASLSFVLALVAGCSAPPAAQSPAPFRSAAGDSDIRRLVLDRAADGRLCERVRDRFVGLPVENGVSGAAAGATPIGGRWWIRGCSVERDGNALALRLSGPGWYRVDLQSQGFGVHQDVFFVSDTRFSGALDVGYDPATRVASIWVTPSRPADVHIESVAPIDVHPETIGALLMNVFTLGSVPTAVARGQVASQGQQRFRTRLAGGLTLTVDLAHGDQVDLVLGQLPRGVSPLRPFTDGLPWLVNEREQLVAGGVQVAGPFTTQNVVVDGVVERGNQVQFALVCARDVQIAFNDIGAGGTPTLRPAAVFGRGQFAPGTAGSWRFSASCPWYLLSTTPDASALAAVRVRDLGSASVTRDSAIVRLTLLSFAVEDRKPGGSAWDFFGGAPDPKISVVANGVHYSLMSTRQDTYGAEVDVALTAPLDVTRGTPIEIRAIDEDAFGADEIGNAVLRVEDLSRGSELTLPLRSGEAVTGSVRVRVDVVR